jgi:hypothetical protein
VLLDVTAFASTHPNPVLEAFGVLDNGARTVISAPATLSADQAAFHATLDRMAGGVGDPGTSGPISLTQPAAITHVTQRVPLSELPSLRGLSLLQQLALLDRADMSRFAADHPGVLKTLATRPPAATVVDTWWTGIPSAKQKDLAAAAPGVIGNLEGVPYATRDRANRSYLSESIQSIRDDLRAGAGRAAGGELARRLHMLEQVRSSLHDGSSAEPRALIGLDPEGEGTAVITVGDVTTADYVGYLVPGMFSSVDTQIVKFTASSERIARDQQAILDRLEPATATRPTPTVAVVAWLGYQSPGLANVETLDLAKQAEAALTSSVQGLRAIRGPHQPFISVMAHSYGSTASLLAVQSGGLTVDALVVVGSPGSPAQSASELSVTDGNVWVGQAASMDPVPATGLFGSRPTDPSYGAHLFGTAGAIDPFTGTWLTAAVSHNDYFVPGTESLRNIELIGIDRNDFVLGVDRSP